MIAAGDIAHEKAKALVESVQDLFGREKRKASGRQFQGERHTVESLADRGDGAGIGDGQPELWLRVLDAGEQQRRRRRCADLLQLLVVQSSSSRGQSERRHA